MLLSDHPHPHYEKTLAHEVICQLRFPTILTINNVRSVSGRISPSTPGSRTCFPPKW